MLKVAGYNNFSRTSNGSIVNTDSDAYSTFVRRQEDRKNVESRLSNLENSIGNMAATLQEILSRLK